MKLRIAALALALAFVAAPALAAAAGSGCPPCGEQSDAGPCASLAASSCCDDAAPAGPAKTAPHAPVGHAALGTDLVVPARALAPRCAHGLAAPTSPLRLSVVRRL